MRPDRPVQRREPLRAQIKRRCPPIRDKRLCCLVQRADQPVDHLMLGLQPPDHRRQCRPAALRKGRKHPLLLDVVVVLQKRAVAAAGSAELRHVARQRRPGHRRCDQGRIGLRGPDLNQQPLHAVQFGPVHVMDGGQAPAMCALGPRDGGIGRGRRTRALVLQLFRRHRGVTPRIRSDRRRSSSTVVSSAIEKITSSVATARMAGLICSRMPFHIWRGMVC